MILMSGGVSAQKKFVRHSMSKVMTTTANGAVTVGTKPLKARAAGAPRLVALHEEEYSYESGAWENVGSYDYVYDRMGNVLKQDYLSEGTHEISEFEYDALGQWLTKAVYTATGDEERKPKTRQTRTFDPKVADFVVESMEYVYRKSDWVLSDMGRTWRRDVQRDARGHVVTLTTSTYFGGEFVPTRRSITTYNDEGVAVAWTHEELSYDGKTWVTHYTLEDMQWHSTDGQVVADDINDFFDGANRLTYAKVIEPGYGETGSITAAYEDNGNYWFSFNYLADDENPVSRDVCTLTYLDANGSMRSETSYYADADGDGVASDDERVEMWAQEAIYNEHGDALSESSYEEDELVGGTKTDYVYDANGILQEWTTNDYDYDAKEYIPLIRIVRSDFFDLATSIATVGSTAGDTATYGVYNMQGVKVADTMADLPAGLYIVRGDGKARKVLKK